MIPYPLPPIGSAIASLPCPSGYKSGIVIMITLDTNYTAYISKTKVCVISSREIWLVQIHNQNYSMEIGLRWNQSHQP